MPSTSRSVFTSASGLFTPLVLQMMAVGEETGALPEGLPVQGNLDPLALLAGGDAMRSAARRILDALAERPHVFNLGHGILQDTPIDHVDELMRLLKGGA